MPDIPVIQRTTVKCLKEDASADHPVPECHDLRRRDSAGRTIHGASEVKSMVVRDYWQERLRSVGNRIPQVQTFAAFNTNIDAIVYLTPELLSHAIKESDTNLALAEHQTSGELPDSVKSPADFLRVIRSQLAEGKSCHMVVEQDVLPWISQVFCDCTERMGGQAGIIANQMAALQATSVVYTRLLPPEQARLFDQRVTMPTVLNDELSLLPIQDVARSDDEVKVNWIFEYPKDATYQFGSQRITTTRANRVIMATRPRGAVIAFSRELDRHLPSLGRMIDVAFMAGYHYANPDDNDGRDFHSYLEYIRQSLSDLTRLNPDLRIHYEYVPLRHEELESDLLRCVCQQVNSFGINENEIRRALRKLGREQLADDIEASERAYTLYRGALALLRELRLDRVHLHNLGYYVIVLRKPYFVSVDDVIGASLYASALNALKAMHGGFPDANAMPAGAELALSEIGFAQLEQFSREMTGKARQTGPGVWEQDDHCVLVTPAHVVANPVSTVGMGDTISSASYAMEVCAARQMSRVP
ncbi:MAG: ADP-dependent glucokinase/phosphofructokinase [Limnochordia bacterium]